MKSRIIKAILLSVSIYGLAGAQEVRFRAEVPFDFRVGDVLMHAGRYSVKTGNNFVAVSNLTSGGGVFRLILPGSRTGDQLGAKLVFKRYDGEYNLASIWASGSTQGGILTLSKRQKELEAAARTPEAAQVPLVASR